MFPAEQISVAIARDWRTVYDFAKEPENFSRWAKGLGASLRKVDDVWVADTAEGQVRVRFSPSNDFGVLDHWVRLPSGDEIYIPLRVIANGRGALAQFTLYRLAGVSDDAFARDAESVSVDLAALKALMEV
jgi:hypothetical protein